MQPAAYCLSGAMKSLLFTLAVSVLLAQLASGKQNLGKEETSARLEQGPAHGAVAPDDLWE